MKRGLFVWAAAAIVMAGAPAPALTLEKVRSASGALIDAVPNQVIVRYRAERAAEGRGKVAAMGATVRDRISSLNVELLTVPSGHTIQSFMAQLGRDPNVEFVEPNGVMKALAFPDDGPDDANFSDQFYLSDSAAARINVRPAWRTTLGVPSVVVAVVDTGVDINNPDLGGRVVQGRQFEIDWFNDNDCDDTVATEPELGACNGCAGVGPDQCASDFAEDDNNVNEFTGNIDANPTYHGTRCAGIIAAQADNGPGGTSGIAGVAPGVSIMPVKVLNSWGFGTFFSIAEGIAWAAENGASVINLSLGGQSIDATGTVQSAISLALDRECVVVAASGNSGNFSSVNFPASFPGVIAVGSIDSTNALSSFSATGKALDLVAPGRDVFSTVPSTVTATAANANTGTSFSAPMVAGVAALIRSLDPAMSWQRVTQYIDFTATDLGAAGFDTNFGFGRLNAGAAVQAAAAGTRFISNPAAPGETFPYPNPFRPGPGREVTIALPAGLGSDGISIDFINVAGEKVRTVNGTNVWDGRNDDGDLVASGFYFYFAKTSRGDAKGKITVIK